MLTATTASETKQAPSLDHVYATEIPLGDSEVRLLVTDISKESLARVITAIHEDYASAAEYNKYFQYGSVEGVIFANPKNVSLRNLKSIFR